MTRRKRTHPWSSVTQTVQRSKENVQNDKQLSTKHTYKTKDRVTRAPLKTGDELMCPGMESSSCATSDTRREYPERTTDPGQATGKLSHLRLRVECTLFCYLQSWARTHAVLVIGLYELLDPTT
jgi:hypothetical protein